METMLSAVDAIEMLAEGFILFGPDDRLILRNTAFARLYPMLADLAVPGVRFEDMIRAGVARGQFPDACGAGAEPWILDRLARRGPSSPSQDIRLADGRVVLVGERPTGDGGRAILHTDVTMLLREALGRLGTRVAHDLNNILAAAMANVEFIDERTDDDDPRKMLAQRALAGLRRGADLSDRLSALAREPETAAERSAGGADAGESAA